MISGNSKFLIGLALGAVAGAMVYKCASSEMARELFGRMCDAMKSKGCSAMRKAADVGVKVADSVAETAHEYRDKIHDAE